jgi:hypothetical protein
MGYDNNVYVGPYIKVFLPKIDVTTKKITCPVETCAGHGKTLSNVKFCSDCGAAVTHCSFTRMETLSIHDFINVQLGNSEIYFVLYKDELSSYVQEEFCILLPVDKEALRLDQHNCGEHRLPVYKEDIFDGVYDKLLFKAFDRHSIRYEKHFGCILYAR